MKASRAVSRRLPSGMAASPSYCRVSWPSHPMTRATLGSRAILPDLRVSLVVSNTSDRSGRTAILIRAAWGWPSDPMVVMTPRRRLRMNSTSWAFLASERAVMGASGSLDLARLAQFMAGKTDRLPEGSDLSICLFDYPDHQSKILDEGDSHAIPRSPAKIDADKLAVAGEPLLAAIFQLHFRLMPARAREPGILPANGERGWERNTEQAGSTVEHGVQPTQLDAAQHLVHFLCARRFLAWFFLLAVGLLGCLGWCWLAFV